MASETITRNDLTAILNSVLPNPTDMTPQEVEDFIDSLLGQGSNIADFVVEQGTDGIWTYRKWNSGIAECWGVKQFSTNLNNQYGGLYYGDTGAVTFPTGLFIAMPSAEASADLEGGVGGCTFNTVSASGISHIYAFNGVSYNYTNRHLHIHAIGKWK